jgi:SAM-dependent methyltransferase
MFRTIVDEIKKLARDPRRLREVFRLRRWRQFFGVLWFDARTGGRWKKAADGEAFQQREYESYGEYVAHQQSKLQYLDLEEYDRKYRRVLGERLRALPTLKPGASVLCLGARQGTEVKAFLDFGCFAVGIDLMPGAGNEYVVRGDFHHLQFATESADVVFTNSLDHAFDPKKMLGEVRRVLKADGRLIVEAMRGEKEEITPDHYASFSWQRVDDLVALLQREGFEPEQRAPFTEPWPGEQICLVKAGKG